MTEQNLESVLRKEWESVRKGYYYPQLPNPRLVDNIPNGYINMQNLSIKVSEPFIRSFRDHGIQEHDALNEILTHELTHFMKYPGSVLNIFRMHKVAREIVDAKKAAELRSAFTEVQTNLYMVKEKNHPSTVAMRKVYKPDDSDPLGKLMYGLYQEVWKQNLGIKLNGKEKSLIKKLRDIDYLDKESEADNLKRFVEVLKDYQPESKQGKNKGDQKQEANEGDQGQDEHQSNSTDMFSSNQIKEGIRQFAQECDNPQEFEQIVKEVLSQREGKESKGVRYIPGVLPGTDKGITLIAENFYSALALKYSIPIRRKPLHKNGSLYPHTHTSFSISDPLSDLDSFSTPGIMPGITKKWVRREGEVSTDAQTVPNSILVIDNSPSMFNESGQGRIVEPDKKIYHHIVGATTISNAYLDNDSRVAVYSFGSNDHFNDFSKDKEEIHKSLRRYSASGGTTFNPTFLEKILGESQEEFDISVVSDMCISNLESFVNTVLKIPKMHRIHLLYTNQSSEAKEYVDHVIKKFKDQENVAILPLIKEADISKIIMGELTKSIA